MEVYTGTEDVIAEESISLCLLDRHAETLNRKRILCTNINITILCAYCVCGDGHTFDHLVWITFHYGTIHKCTRVTFITVTYYVAYFFFLACNLRPFLAGRETSAATSAKSGFDHFIDDILWSHVEESFGHSLEAAYCDIFINGFCVDISAVFQNDPGLLIQERNV